MSRDPFYAEIDTSGLERVIAVYAEKSGKTMAEALRKHLGNWCFFALKRLRQGLGRTGRMVAWPKLGAKGSAKENWRLVRWLAARRIENGLGGHVTHTMELDSRLGTKYHTARQRETFRFHRRRLWVRDAKTGKIHRAALFKEQPDLAAISEAERKARDKSKGFLKAQVLAMKNAVRQGAPVRGGGIAATSAVTHGLVDAQAAVVSVVRFASDLTYAMQPRGPSNESARARVIEAFNDAQMDVVADIEKYLARKFEQAMKKSFKKAHA